MAIHVLIADDHPLIRSGLRTLLSATNDIQVIGEANNGQEAIALSASLKPDVIIMDIRMPDLGGLEATRHIVQASPETKVLVVTLFEDDDTVFAALRAGARGYVVKDATENELLLAIRAVNAGDVIFSASIARRMLAYFSVAQPVDPRPFPELTSREHEILTLIARGLNNHEIASTIYISVKTVRNYISTIFNKLQVADRAQAIVRARDAGMGTQDV